MIDKIKKICILGFSNTGIALARLCLSLGKEVLISDKSEENKFSYPLISYFKNLGVKFEFGGHSYKFIGGSDLIVVSPGVNLEDPEIKSIISKISIPCIGEIEFSFWFNKAPIIAITGTNGKSTVTYLTYKILKEKYKRVFLGGNIGIPFARFAAKTSPTDLVVLEISSFQLETIVRFRPHIACFLNIEPDHLDRYKSFDDYFKAKLNIFRNQSSTDWAVLNKNMELLGFIEKYVNAKKVYFSSELENANFSASFKIAKILGVDDATILKVISQFSGLKHRLEIVGRINGVEFINDSKATNPHSTIWALSNIKKPIILIAGGKDKGVDYRMIIPYLKKVERINLIGQASSKIKEALEGVVDMEAFPTLEEAVYNAYKHAKKDSVVLLSPMCASFDMFMNYKDRGNVFRSIVKKILKDG